MKLKSIFNRLRFTIALAVALALSLEPVPTAHAATFTVTNTDDSGVGSLRQAILDASTTAGTDTITFSVSGTITVGSTLSIAEDVTIDGSGQSITISGNNAVLVMRVLGRTTNLMNLTVANGLGQYGGGISIEPYATLIVSNSTFAGNYATYDGGGIYNGGWLTVSNSTFSGNYATYNGGGIYNGGVLTVSNSTFAGNYATYDSGGGISNDDGWLTVSNSTFSENSAIYGGGISNQGLGTLTVSNSTFSGNSATYGGGDGYGGGIANVDEGWLTVSNSTFSGNSADNGGGIANVWLGTLIVSNSTFAGNSGGGIGSTSGLLLRNTIIANSLGGWDCGGDPILQINNLIEDGSCTPLLSGDPNLGPLANNGGPTQTHALLPGSPAIDAGDPATCAAAPVNNLDQRGIARPQGTTCDIGAFELEQVVYNFSGFFQPVDNLPMLNVAKAGSAIPIKFSLGGDQGLNIFAADFPRSQPIDCDSTAPNDGIEETVTAGNSSLSYDAASDTYTYTWKTDKLWANTCRQLTLRLSDGADHVANFMFRK